jgi:hypothetical protein
MSRAKVTDDDRTIYAILREEFTAADLQKYTEVEPMIPVEQILAEMEMIHKKEQEKLLRRLPGPSSPIRAAKKKKA